MTNGDLYIPSNVQLGGQRTSNSQLKTIATCWQEFFLSYLAPHPDVEGSAGLEGYTTSDGLIIGGYIHTALEAYRLSGWRDGGDSGEYDIEFALAVLRERHTARQAEAESPEQGEENLEHAKQVILKYDELFDSYINLRTVGDSEGEPVLEREFQIPLGDGEFVYTNKIDRMGINKAGYHLVVEYKSTQTRYVNEQVNSFHMTGQAYGHMGVITTANPGAPIMGIHLDVFATKRPPTSKIPYLTQRSDITIPGENIETYFTHVLGVLHELVDKVGQWQRWLDEGQDPYFAGAIVFPKMGLWNGLCRRYYRFCDFAPYCENHGLGGRVLKGMKPKTVNGEPYEGEENE